MNRVTNLLSAALATGILLCAGCESMGGSSDGDALRAPATGSNGAFGENPANPGAYGNAGLNVEGGSAAGAGAIGSGTGGGSAAGGGR